MGTLTEAAKGGRFGVRYAEVGGERGRFGVRDAEGSGERERGLMQGSYGAVAPRPAPHPGALAARPAGKRPCAFPRTPFAASVKKICLIGTFFK